MSLRRPAVALLAACLAAGCATRSADIVGLATPATAFEGLSCDELYDEMERVQQRAADVAYAVDTQVGNNLFVLTLGTTIFWPALFAMRPDGPDADELARLKGRYEALQSVAAAQRCPPAGDVLPARRAAGLPVAPGDRLVYEERSGRSGPAQEFSLTVRALKRGEVDFLLQRPSGPPTLWRQDAAGNALAPQPHDLMSWTHLLHRDLALGDVLAGDLHGPDGEERAARVRGQVVATGPQQVSGHSFDAATIELFGDVPNGPGSSIRVDGVMAVDRASGVLLRLELRSGNAEYALRRRLVRVEPPR